MWRYLFEINQVRALFQKVLNEKWQFGKRLKIFKFNLCHKKTIQTKIKLANLLRKHLIHLKDYCRDAEFSQRFLKYTYDTLKTWKKCGGMGILIRGEHPSNLCFADN